MGMQGYVMQLQPFSVNDGEGIRTIIFLAGCPMHCRWCSNPEGMHAEELIGWYERRCIGCGECAKVCPRGIGIDLNAEREKCDACGLCAEACPKGARSRLVSLCDADELVAQADRHAMFYRESGGGITFSGGEATSNPELLDYLSRRLYDRGYSLALETCGYFKFETLRPTLERFDKIFMDLKIMDEEKHRQYTGVPNAPVLDNIRNLARLDADVTIRIPVIGGVNDDEANIRNSAKFVHENLPKASMELLPYHRFGILKYEALGLPLPPAEFFRPADEAMDRLREIIREEGVETADYR